MKQENFSRSFSNRRAIVFGSNPVIEYNTYKQNMKMFEVRQRFDEAQYQAKQRYIKSHTPLPQFGYSAVTETVDYCQSQTQSETFVEQISSFEEVIMKSSFKELYERISLQYANTILKESPKTPHDWYYATGGIMPYRK